MWNFLEIYTLRKESSKDSDEYSGSAYALVEFNYRFGNNLQQIQNPSEDYAPDTRPSVIVVYAPNKIIKMGDVDPSPHGFLSGATGQGPNPRISCMWPIPKPSFIIVQSLLVLRRLPLSTSLSV